MMKRLDKRRCTPSSERSCCSLFDQALERWSKPFLRCVQGPVVLANVAASAMRPAHAQPQGLRREN